MSNERRIQVGKITYSPDYNSTPWNPQPFDNTPWTPFVPPTKTVPSISDIMKELDEMREKNSDADVRPHHERVKTSNTTTEYIFNVAGFDKSNIKVYVQKQKLVVESNIDESEKTLDIFKNIHYSYKLRNNEEVVAVSCNNGILIVLTNIDPVSDKQEYEVGYEKKSSDV